MNKSSFGSHFTVTTWGESHGKALGAVIDGCPAGLSQKKISRNFWTDANQDKAAIQPHVRRAIS